MWREGVGGSRQAVILAGGKGTRLRSRLGAKPKPLVEIGGIPLLGHQLELLRKHGFTNVVLLVNYAAEQIYEYCHSFDARQMSISIIDDGTPRGTAGAVLKAAPRLAPQFLVLYGDTMLDVDLTRFWDWHLCVENTTASLLLHSNDHPQDSDLVEIDAECRIVRFHPYPRAANCYLPNLVNAALYIVRRDALLQYDEDTLPLDFAKDLFPRMLQSGGLLRGYLSSEYIKDVGTPERLDSVNRDFSSGAIARASLSSSKPAVFVDRDGTLNEDRGHITSPGDLVTFDFVGPALRRLNQAGRPAIIITNQPVVARGEASYRDLQRIQGKLDEEVARHGAYFDRVYFCPHHPESGFPGEVSELKVKCACRKPAPGMIFQAQRELNLDLAECWFIGDTLADIGAAAAANVTSILALTGLACNIGEYAWQPDFIASDFARAVDLILDIYPLLSRACQPILELIDSGSEWFVAGPSESARRTIIGTLKRELRRRGKPAEVRRLTAERLNGSYGSDRRLTSCSDAVILWEGSTALEFSRDCGMLHHSIWAQDSPGFRDEQIPASEAAYFFDLHEILSPNKTPEGVAA